MTRQKRTYYSLCSFISYMGKYKGRFILVMTVFTLADIAITIIPYFIGIILTNINWQTGAIFVIGLLLMLLVGRFTIRNNTRYEQQFTDLQSTKNGRLVDAIANFVNVKSFHKEIEEWKGVEHEQQKVIDGAHKSFFWGIVFWGSMSEIVRDMIWPITIGYNVYLFLHGHESLAQLTTVLSTVLLFTNVIWEMIWYTSQFNLKLARIEEAHLYLFGKINLMQAISGRDTMSTAPAFNEALTFDGLSFAYPDNKQAQVLHEISLTVRRGEKLGIVGRSGSGKTTLTKLLLGYYPVESGLLVDKESVNSRTVAQLVSYVPQDTSLFHRSIAENISYAADGKVSRKQIIAAAKQAHAHEFIERIQGGYDALVGERGVKLSAGQRQRIAIARAFLDNKPILILDEATSALDSESEVLVQESLESLWEHKTVIAIAHRLSTLRNMDRIIVMDHGRIIEEGTHAELLAQNGQYAKLWTHQSGGFIEE